MPAMPPHARTKAGKIKWAIPPRPNVGSHPKIPPNSMINMMAIQKLGAAIPTMAKNLPKVSKMLSRFTADNMPRGIPNNRVSPKAAPASCTVAGKRSNNTSRAGRSRK